MNKIQKILSNAMLLTLVFMTSSCVVGHRQIEGVSNSKKYDKFRSCDFMFHVSVSSKGNLSKKNIKNYENEFRKVLESVFVTKNCQASYGKRTNSSLIVDIEIPPFLGASAGAYLNAFSLGMMPTWDKTLDFKVIFEDKHNKVKKVYKVYTKSYNHIIFLPFFWTMFFTLDSENLFKNLLSDFLSIDPVNQIKN